MKILNNSSTHIEGLHYLTDQKYPHKIHCVGEAQQRSKVQCNSLNNNLHTEGLNYALENYFSIRDMFV